MATEYTAGHKLVLLNSGQEYFPSLLQAIKAARNEIYLETYLFANDPIGQTVANALKDAALLGVRVNVTVDGFGGRNFRTDFARSMHQAGVHTAIFRPEVGQLHFRRHRLRRMHRKLVVIDGKIGFVGGINIIDDDNADIDMRPRYDYAVRIEGPLLAELHHAVRRQWEMVSWVNFKRRQRSPPPPSPCCPVSGDQLAAFRIRDNIRHRNDILNAYLEAIANARHEILIANAYFLPGVRFGLALQQAARRGVRITILLQGKTDHHLLRFATQTLYDAVLRCGIRIFEYEKSFMHAKVAVIDGEWATVGSSNIDPFSLLLAREANLFVRDTGFARQLQTSIEHAIASGAKEMHLEQLKEHPMHWRLLRWLSYGLVRLLVGLAGYGPKHWQSDTEASTLRPTGR